MRFVANLPDWLVACFRIALLGEIYCNVRAIAVGFDDRNKVLIRYYLDREPTDFDLESIEIVAVNFDALRGGQEVKEVAVQCVYSAVRMNELDPLSGFIFARREYGMNVIRLPNSNVTSE